MEIFQMENVIELEKERQNREQNNAAPSRDDVWEAMLYGLEHSVHSKDSSNPDPNAPGSIGLFFKHVADLDPRFYLALIAKLAPPND
jgi:hypothetical protein